jgi:hypothetical protein
MTPRATGTREPTRGSSTMGAALSHDAASDRDEKAAAQFVNDRAAVSCDAAADRDEKAAAQFINDGGRRVA